MRTDLAQAVDVILVSQNQDGQCVLVVQYDVITVEKPEERWKDLGAHPVLH